MSRARQLERDEVEDQIDVRRQMSQEDQDAIDEMDEWITRVMNLMTGAYHED